MLDTGRIRVLVCVICGLPNLLCMAEDASLQVNNGGFEELDSATSFANAWTPEIGGEADARVVSDDQVFHGGSRSIRIENRSPLQAFVFAAFRGTPIPVEPDVTYVVRFWAKGKSAKSCYVGVSFSSGGDRRQYLASGDFDWREFACTFTVPEKASSIVIRFACDDVTEGFWVDDVTVERSPLKLANLREKKYRKPFRGVFPRSKGGVSSHLLVCDCTQESLEMRRLLSALQGLVNRQNPQIYLINPTNPPQYDLDWLHYMQDKGYTGSEQAVEPEDLMERFQRAYRGAVVYDEALPGTINAAFMLAGHENLLPATAELAADLNLPVIIDLRGKWTRNVDTYRYVYDKYRHEICRHVLSWIYPGTDNTCARDYMVEFNIFSFWVSSYADNEPGADPAAEEAFLNELLADTPANIPVMGWPMYGDNKGIQEYTGVRWLSEYGKFVPGTEFCSNLSVHTAIHPDNDLFRQKTRELTPVALEKDKAYVATSIMDSGDALWYWQFHQRKIWADPVRGSVPVGWCMNITLYDTLPLVLQWYYENATPNDEFFAALSGLGYMNTQVYASRFRPEDRERIWKEYVSLTDRYCRRLDIRGIGLYNGSWGEKTPPDSETFARFVQGMKNLDYILADLGRHENVTPQNAAYKIGQTAVFHTLTRFQVWSSSAEVNRNDMAKANAWLLDEIKGHTPPQRPAFLSAMAISWYYYPSWLKDLKDKLPLDYIAVTPAQLADLYRR